MGDGTYSSVIFKVSEMREVALNTYFGQGHVASVKLYVSRLHVGLFCVEY